MKRTDSASIDADRTAPTSFAEGMKRHVTVVRALLGNPLDIIPPAAFYEPIVHTRAFGRTVVYVMAPELVQQALSAGAANLEKGENVRRPLKTALGEGLLTAEEEDWRWQRAAIAPVFRALTLDRFLPAMIAQAEASRDRMLAMAPGDIVANHEMMRLTFDIIVETMLSGSDGFDVAEVEASVSEYLQLARWSSLTVALGIPEWAPYPGKQRSVELATILRRSVLARVAERRLAATPRGDLIDLLIQASDPQTGRCMTDEEIADNLLTFLTAGHETTALGLAWTLDLLGRHPEIAARIRAEIDEVTQGGPVQPAHIASLTYTRQTFQEAIRLYPPAAILPRRVAMPIEIGGKVVAADTTLIVPVYAIHRHNTLWEAPHVFNPDRFAPDAVAGRHRYAFMPFGAGPRICIGSGFAMMEAVAILAVLLQKLHFTPSSAKPPEPRLDVTLRPSDPLNMHVNSRY